MSGVYIGTRAPALQINRPSTARINWLGGHRIVPMRT
jgi:hypothetical protein